MHRFSHRFACRTAAISTLLGLLFVQSANAAIAIVANYHLGENDPGAIAGNTGNATTVDSAGSNDLARTGAPTYSSNTGGAFSALSMSLNGTTDYYSASTSTITGTDNFGAEIMVNAPDTQSSAVVMSSWNGSTSWSLWESNGHWNILFENYGPGGFTQDTSAATAVAVGAWTQLALVVNGGSTTLYINGVAGPTLAFTPTAPTTFVNIGAEGGGAKFAGLVDEARVFTFAPGAFQVSDLTYPVPEPSTFAVAVVAVTFLARRRHGRQG